MRLFLKTIVFSSLIAAPFYLNGCYSFDDIDGPRTQSTDYSRASVHNHVTYSASGSDISAETSNTGGTPTTSANTQDKTTTVQPGATTVTLPKSNTPSTPSTGPAVPSMVPTVE